MLYKNCRELPYHNFNEVQLTKDLSYLIKDKEKHDFKELQDHWVNILEEYFDLTNNFEQKKFFRDKAELKYLQLKLTTLIHLRELTKFDINEDNQKLVDLILKKYYVKNIDTDILATKDDINIKKARFKKTYEENKNNKHESSFEDSLSVLRLNGVSINRMEVTVSEYVSLLKRYRDNSKNTSKK